MVFIKKWSFLGGGLRHAHKANQALNLYGFIKLWSLLGGATVVIIRHR